VALTKDIGPLKPRVDFQKSDFDRLILQKGYRVLWSASELCPCRNPTTDQANPGCVLCDGDGFVYVFPDPTEPDLIDYAKETPAFANTASERATQAIMTSLVNNPQIFEKFGEWLSGTAALTTFSWNRVGHRDRFKVLDHTQLYRQVLEVPSSQIIPVGNKAVSALRYPVVRLRRAFSADDLGVTVDYTETVEIQPDGSLKVTAPPKTKLSIAYEMNPVWVVVDYPHIVRGTLIKFKTGKVLGDNEVHPIQAMVRLDYLLGKDATL
jgi:hypothetical protein